MDSFYTEAGNASIGMFAKVEDAIAIGDYSLAMTINSSISAATIFERNQQMMNDLILRPLRDSTYIYTSTDSIALYTIAIQCPVAGGDAVAQARNLLMSITHNILEFPDDCSTTHRNLVWKIPVVKEEKAFKLYPNPNNGTMLLDYSLDATDIAELIIYDVAGKLLDKYNLAVSNTQFVISNHQLKDGVYFYRINVNGSTVQTDKLVIIE